MTIVRINVWDRGCTYLFYVDHEAERASVETYIPPSQKANIVINVYGNFYMMTNTNESSMYKTLMVFMAEHPWQ